MSRVIAEGRTPFQEYKFCESEAYGVCVTLDGDLQSCEADEARYHEALVHPAMLLHPNPKRVLIMGGGEGATAREVLKHKSVEKVVMVDIDAEFVALCKRHIPTWGASAFSDARLELLHQDINVYLEQTQECFDVVIGDLIDVSDWESDVAKLYAKELYGKIKAQLNPNAIIATQAGTLALGELGNHTKIRESLLEVFSSVESYGVEIPSFESLWGFIIAGENLPSLEEIEKELLKSSFEPKVLGKEGIADAFSMSEALEKKIGV